jgi:molecular chaperone IbpA
MRTYDLTPLFRTSIGFDRMSRLFDAAMQLEASAKSYPPYNIVRAGEDAYRITLAVAGFTDDDLDVVVQNNTLTITGRSETDGSVADPEYLHRGIASRAFERRFQLADQIEVTDAQLDNGLLHVELVREVPEALKPRTIAIQRGSAKAIAAAK